MQTVAVLGLGSMGSRIARRVLDAGHRTIVWNRTIGKTAALAERGALTVATPAEAAAQAEVVVTMLADADALLAVARGPNGIAAGVHDSLVIDMSTVGPDAVTKLRSLLPANTAVVDAPVLGSVAEAEAGALVIYMGGSPIDTERALPLLSLLGKPVHVGPLGSGAAAKLIANLALFGVVSLLGESIALGHALGLPRDAVWNVLGTTPLGPQAERRRASIDRRAFPRRFALALADKDSRLIATSALASDLRLHLGRAVCAWFDEAAAAGLGAEDYTAVLAHITDQKRRDDVTGPPAQGREPPF
jgi:3-hydroxyisobutyrate dehydrogenase